MLQPGEAYLAWEAKNPTPPGEEAFVDAFSYYVLDAGKILESEDPATAAREAGYYYCRADGLLGLLQICNHAEVTSGGGVIHREKGFR